jgi:general secretion pathway protein A
MPQTRFRPGQRPFRNLPDSTAYYPATSHERVLKEILRACQEEQGLVLMTGESGLGKTLLCHCLVERLGLEVTTAFLVNSRLPDRAGLLQAILFDLGLPHEGRREQDLRLCLTEFLLNQFQAGKRTILIFDEAHHLTVDLLEELRLLGNLESRHGKSVQVVLSAQPAILDRLKRPELAGFRQRLANPLRLEPMGRHETADFLVHQVRMAGGKAAELFTDEAIEVLTRGSLGVPRLLNQAASQALNLADEAAVCPVDAEVALEALHVLGLADEDAESSGIILPANGAVLAAPDGLLADMLEDEGGHEIPPGHTGNGNHPPPNFGPTRFPA